MTFPTAIDTFATVYDDGSSITETGRAIASLGGGNYGFTLGVGTGIRNIPRGGFPQGLPIASNAGSLTATPFGTGGQIEAGDYKYMVTLMTQFGETLGLTLGSNVTAGTSVASIVLTNIPLVGTTPTDANPVLGRRIYRTTLAGTPSGTKYLVAQIDDATTTSLTDTLLDADLGPSFTGVSDGSGLLGVVALTTNTNPSVGTITTWTERALPTPLAPLANHSGTTAYFAVDYSYGPSGGTLYVSGDVTNGTVNTAYTGGTVPSAAIQNGTTTAITNVETTLGNGAVPGSYASYRLAVAALFVNYGLAILGGGSAHPNNANIQLTEDNIISWGSSGGNPAITGHYTGGKSLTLSVTDAINLTSNLTQLSGALLLAATKVLAWGATDLAHPYIKGGANDLDVAASDGLLSLLGHTGVNVVADTGGDVEINGDNVILTSGSGDILAHGNIILDVNLAVQWAGAAAGLIDSGASLFALQSSLDLLIQAGSGHKVTVTGPVGIDFSVGGSVKLQLTTQGHVDGRGAPAIPIGNVVNVTGSSTYAWVTNGTDLRGTLSFHATAILASFGMSWVNPYASAPVTVASFNAGASGGEVVMTSCSTSVLTFTCVGLTPGNDYTISYIVLE